VRCAAYVRVSRESQDLGPTVQREAIAAWAKAHSHTVESWHEDHGVSGGKSVEDRPGLFAALASMKALGKGSALVVHKRDTESASDAEPPVDPDDHELLWELRRLLASSGGTIADVAHALERRGDDVDRKARELLHDEVLTIEMDIAALKVLLSDAVDWDTESRRLLAGEIPPFEGPVVEEDDDDEDE